MSRRQLSAFELGNPIFQPAHAFYQLIRVTEPDIDRTRPLIKSPQHFSLGIANRFGQFVSNLLNGLGKILGGDRGNLLNGLGKILLGCWLTTHT
jgi:hypothetical protein